MEKYGLTLKYHAMDPFPQDVSASIMERLSGANFIDKDNRFTFSGEPHTAVALVVSRDPFSGSDRDRGYLSLSGEDLPLFVGYEDESGNYHDMRDCQELTPSRHVYGCLYNREDGSSWLFVPKAGDDFYDGMITADAIRSGAYAPLRVAGQTEFCADNFAKISEIVDPSDGEFVFSGDDDITLLGIPWMGGNGDKALVEALEDVLIDHEAALGGEAPSTPSFG